ncbi:MAG: acyl-CoA dehydratase activase [Nitrospiraceae bacterium]|nr:acyl-CoA dehydratase activase [Nitrospiraceae bacterium]
MVVGVDLGSRTIKVAAVEGGRLAAFKIAESGYDPHRQSLEMIRDYRPGKIVATGYGRHLAKRHFADDVITEIKAHATGARYFFSDCRTILDVGGQDTKVIALDQIGRVQNFQMNDKCAAGTGRFLEIMAASLGYSLSEFGTAAMRGMNDVRISNMCTVFAESEVISLKNHGAAPADIAKAVHISVIERLIAMLARIGYGDSVVFTGGVAKNPAAVNLLKERLGVNILVPDPPDIVGALGAALYGEDGTTAALTDNKS